MIGHLLKSMEWVKRKGKIGKVEPSKKFYKKKNSLISVKFQELY